MGIKRIEFRDLTASEVECRINQVKENYVALLLYKTARADMDILDETVGAENWQREHYDCKGNLFCRVGINVNYDDELKSPDWVWKADCGSESRTEKEKGESSDSFKRACVCWGIGRELYTAPPIYINANLCDVRDTKKLDKCGKPILSCFDNFKVNDIAIQNKRIVGLSIVRADRQNRQWVTVFTYGKRNI